MAESSLSYEELVAEVENLPMTMLPALLVRVVVASYKAGSFLPGGASNMIRRIEKEHDLGKEKAAEEETDSGSDERLPPPG